MTVGRLRQRPSSTRRSTTRTTSFSRCCSRRKRLRRGGCEAARLVAPYLCYMRQDAAFSEAKRSARRWSAGCSRRSLDRVITVDAHLHRTARHCDVFPGIEADNLSAMPASPTPLRTEGIDPATVVVGPDAEFATVGERSRRPARSQLMPLRERRAAAIVRSRSL